MLRRVAAFCFPGHLREARRATDPVNPRFAWTRLLLEWIDVERLILCASGYATFQRNKVWKTWREEIIRARWITFIALSCSAVEAAVSAAILCVTGSAREDTRL